MALDPQQQCGSSGTHSETQLVRPFPQSRPRRAGRAFAASLALAAFAGGPIAGAFHQALVHHEVCAEHGALVHVGDRPHDAAAPHDDREPGWRETTARALHGGHTHEHCGLASHRRTPVAGPEKSRAASVTVLVRGAASAQAIVSPLASVAILALAPKSSPPLLA